MIVTTHRAPRPPVETPPETYQLHLSKAELDYFTSCAFFVDTDDDIDTGDLYIALIRVGGQRNESVRTEDGQRDAASDVLTLESRTA